MERREQNKVNKEWRAFILNVIDLDRYILPVLARGTHESGVKVLPRGTKVDPEDKTQTLSYADPTGEEAIRYELPSSINGDIKAIATHIQQALNTARSILSVVPATVSERAQQSVPNCSACGDLITGKKWYGRWDDKCRSRFRRWVALGNQPDEKYRFEQMVRTERMAKSATPEQEWRIEAIDTLQERGELPTSTEAV